MVLRRNETDRRYGGPAQEIPPIRELSRRRYIMLSGHSVATRVIRFGNSYDACTLRMAGDPASVDFTPANPGSDDDTTKGVPLCDYRMAVFTVGGVPAVAISLSIQHCGLYPLVRLKRDSVRLPPRMLEERYENRGDK